MFPHSVSLYRRVESYGVCLCSQVPLMLDSVGVGRLDLVKVLL
jgi:hypothetical protein